MFAWFKNKTQLEKLKCRYSKLMKCAYTVAPKNKQKCDQLHEEAKQLLVEIDKLENVLSHNKRTASHH